MDTSAPDPGELSPEERAWVLHYRTLVSRGLKRESFESTLQLLYLMAKIGEERAAARPAPRRPSPPRKKK